MSSRTRAGWRRIDLRFSGRDGSGFDAFPGHEPVCVLHGAAADMGSVGAGDQEANERGLSTLNEVVGGEAMNIPSCR